MSKIRTECFIAPEDMEYTVLLNTERDKEKFIRRVEKVVRSSMEYRDYIAFLKEYVDMSHCAFFTGVENGNGSRVRIEIHHEPLTLFDIVKVVVDKHIKEGIPLNDLFIADEVMKIHYENKVGLVPLSKSVHQIVHNSSDIVIPLNLVYGDYRAFLEEYDEYIEDDALLDKLERKVNETKHIQQSMIDKLNPSYVYVEVEGFNLPQKMNIEKHIKEVS